MEKLILSQRLKELRMKNHYTQAFVSSKLNIGRATYSNYEIGKRMPSLDIVVDFAKFYQVSLSYLLFPEEQSSDFEASDFSSLLNSEDELQLLALYRTLSDSRKQQVIDFITFLRTLS